MAQLYVVALPIGNVDDITQRALKTLAAVDFIVAEDTRHSGRLLHHYQIKTQMLAGHTRDEAKITTRVIELLAQGKSIALVSDAGTPALNDPGAYLVNSVRRAGFEIIPIPGACAAIVAWSAAGIAGPHFYYYGFLPNSAKTRQNELDRLFPRADAILFYEAPHRIESMMADLRECLGGAQKGVLARELTKQFETIVAGTLDELIAYLSEDEHHRLGEFVVIIEGQKINTEAQQQQIDSVLCILLPEVPLKQAVSITQKITGLAKNVIYERALVLKKP